MHILFMNCDLNCGQMKLFKVGGEETGQVGKQLRAQSSLRMQLPITGDEI